MPAAYAVIVDVPAAESERALSAISTCNKALGPGRCQLQSGEPEPAEWFAVVRFSDDTEQSCSIALHEGDPNGPNVATTELRFSALDAPEERWASAGVVVAALVLAQRPSTPPPKPLPVTPPAPRVAPPVRKPPEPSAWLRGELGGGLASDFAGGPWQAGVLTRVGVAFNHPAAFVLGSLSYGVRPGGSPRLSWLGTALGFGAHVGLADGRAALELRTEAVLDSVSIEATAGRRSQSAERLRLGPRWGLDGAWYFAEKWALVAGAQVAVMRPAVLIEVGGQSVQRLPPFGWGFISVLRYDLR